jgi:hypothetical protein
MTSQSYDFPIPMIFLSYESKGARVVTHKLIHDIVRGSIHQTSGTKLRSLSIRGIEILQAPSRYHFFTLVSVEIW